AARAPADGYTLMVGSSAVWVNASLYPQLPYDPVRDFEPIIIGATSPEVLVVHPSVRAQNVQELVTLVRAGQYNNFAIAGVGTPPHLSTELFKLSLKLDIVAPQCIWAPMGTPGDIIELLYREIARAIASPDVKEKMEAIGYEPAAVPP